MQIKPASKVKSKLRMGLVGPSGSGKTFTSLAIAGALGHKVCVIDTERGSAAKYRTLFPDIQFDTIDDLADEPGGFSPLNFARAIRMAEAAGYEVIIIDSLSHAWEGKGGAMEMVDKVVAMQKTKNTFTAWAEVTPDHREMIDAILTSSAHVICTMRAKTEYVIERDDRGRNTPRKVGIEPIQRKGMEFEFDIVGDIEDATLTITKTRFNLLHREVIKNPGRDLGLSIKAWLDEGIDAPPPAPKPAPGTHAGTGAGTSKVGGGSSPALTDDQRKTLSDMLEKMKQQTSYAALMGLGTEMTNWPESMKNAIRPDFKELLKKLAAEEKANAEKAKAEANSQAAATGPVSAPDPVPDPAPGPGPDREDSDPAGDHLA